MLKTWFWKEFCFKHVLTSLFSWSNLYSSVDCLTLVSAEYFINISWSAASVYRIELQHSVNFKSRSKWFIMLKIYNSVNKYAPKAYNKRSKFINIDTVHPCWYCSLKLIHLIYINSVHLYGCSLCLLLQSIYIHKVNVYKYNPFVLIQSTYIDTIPLDIDTGINFIKCYNNLI